MYSKNKCAHSKILTVNLIWSLSLILTGKQTRNRKLTLHGLNYDLYTLNSDRLEPYCIQGTEKLQG